MKANVLIVVSSLLLVLILGGCSTFDVYGECKDDYCFQWEYKYGDGRKFANIDVYNSQGNVISFKHDIGSRTYATHSEIEGVYYKSTDDPLYILITAKPTDSAIKADKAYGQNSFEGRETRYWLDTPKLYEMKDGSVYLLGPDSTTSFIEKNNIKIWTSSFEGGRSQKYVVVEGHWRSVPYSPAQPTRPSRTWVDSYTRSR